MNYLFSWRVLALLIALATVTSALWFWFLDNLEADAKPQPSGLTINGSSGSNAEIYKGIEYKPSTTLGCAALTLSHDSGELRLDSTCPLYGHDVKSVWVDNRKVWP